MARLVWSEEALRALDGIAAYYREVAPLQAIIVVRQLRAGAQRISIFPRSGRTVPEFELDFIREVLVERYRIIYEVDADTVTVLTVFHTSMDVRSRLRQMRP